MVSINSPTTSPTTSPVSSGDASVAQSTDVRLIGIDWGSSGLRIFLIGANGVVLASRDAPHGITVMQNSQKTYSEILNDLAADWFSSWPDAPVLACGMVGSKHGWQEVPYVQCPANARQIAGKSIAVNDGAKQADSSVTRLAIVPGLLYRTENVAPDVMRGEETQIIGALLSQPEWARQCCIVMPGTHSKWAHILDDQVSAFATHMTGELFAVLRQHSVLGRLMPQADGTKTDGAKADTQHPTPDQTSFFAGVDAARNSPHAGLGHQLFSVRTLGLMGDIPETGLADYLSGLLIGHELVAGLAWRTNAGLAKAPLILVGEQLLCQRYALALQRFDIDVTAVLPNTAPAGLWSLALASGLVSA